MASRLHDDLDEAVLLVVAASIAIAMPRRRFHSKALRISDDENDRRC
jgi:hypothetical protein